jgi:hypothetical protein
MLMDAECVVYAELMSGSAVTSERRKWPMKLAAPLGRVIGAFPAKMVVDLSWLADPLSIAVLNTGLAVAILWAAGFWEPLK